MKKISCVSILLSWLLALPAGAQEAVGIAKPWQLGFQDPATPSMHKLYALHNHLLLYIITVITIFVLALTAYIMVRFHRRNHPTPSRVAHNTTLEVVWTVIPIIILVVIAIPSLRTHYFMQHNPDYQMTLKVVGHQWYWSYEYPDQGGFGFDSYIVKDEDLKPGQHRLLDVDNRAVVPVDTVVRVQMTAADVIHSWSVPAFGVKRDAVPGRLNETWFKAEKPGVYYGQCSQLCGVGHGFMPVAVEVVSREQFDTWVKAKQKEAGIPAGGAANVVQPVPPSPAPQGQATPPQAETVPVPQAPVQPGSPKEPKPSNIAPQAPPEAEPAKPSPLDKSQPAQKSSKE